MRKQCAHQNTDMKIYDNFVCFVLIPSLPTLTNHNKTNITGLAQVLWTVHTYIAKVHCNVYCEVWTDPSGVHIMGVDGCTLNSMTSLRVYHISGLGNLSTVLVLVSDNHWNILVSHQGIWTHSTDTLLLQAHDSYFFSTLHLVISSLTYSTLMFLC